MHRTPVRLAIAFAFAATALHAQNNTVAPQGGARPADPGAKKVLGLADIGRWNRIANTTLSADGKWMAYVVTPNEGDGTLFVRQLDGTTIHNIPVGSAPAFSDDARYVGYYVSPPSAGRGGRGAGGGAPGGGRGGAAPAAGPQRRFELLDLSTGDKSFRVPDAASFKFSKGSRFVAIRTNKANAAARHNGADMVLRELTTGVVQNVGNVNLYEFDDNGKMLAYTVDAADRVGNGVYLIDLASSQSKVLSSAAADYDQLTWGDKGASLTALRGDKKRENLQRDNALLVWQDMSAAKPRAVEYDPSKDASFPKGFVLSEFTAPRFTRDGTKIYVGLKDQEADPAATPAAPNAEPKPNVDVWHWKDAEVQSVQMVRLAQERRVTQPAVFNLAANKLVRISDSVMRNVTPTPDPKWAIGRVDTTYRTEVQWGASKGDYYRVSTDNGERTLIDKALSRTMGNSPDGKWFLYLKDKKVFAFNTETGRNAQLAATDKISFIDVSDDHPYELPTYGVAGWTKDGKSVILNHQFDLYVVPLDGSKITNLTGGLGASEQTVFRIVRLDRQGGGGGRGGRGGFGGGAAEEDEGIDLTKPLMLSAYGEWTKKSGYFTMAPGAKPTPLIYEEASVGGTIKAEKTDRVVFTRQTFGQFPDYWLSNTSFASPSKLTDANPFINEYGWGTKKLIDFKNSKGQRLQGTLTLPANYQPGKKYPMLVYFYEILSNTHHNFPTPAFDDRPHFAEYASDGYLVFQPDIVYEIGKPGSSALDCVTSGVKEVIRQGFADPAKIGMQGHSWGGYQSSFILTQTNMFAAVVTGAPPTNLVSFYDETYPGTGTLQQGITEVGQVRMGTNPWDSHELFENQSPIYHVRNIKTPFMILHGTVDNAVDWHQGLEFYGAARRWGKEVIFLSYPNEPHHLGRKENQKDFQERMKQFFDHYLKGTPAPKWMTEGVPQTRKVR